MFKFILHNDEFGDLELPSAPINWDSIDATLERSPTLWAVNREVGSSELRFYGSAYNYLKGILKSQFVDAEIILKIYWSEDLKLNDWQLLKQYNLTFHGMIDDGTTISAQINSGEIESIFEANLDTTFEIEMDDTVTIKPVRLREVGNFKGADSVFHTETEDAFLVDKNLIWEADNVDLFVSDSQRVLFPFLSIQKNSDKVNFNTLTGIYDANYAAAPNKSRYFLSWQEYNENWGNGIQYNAKFSEKGKVKVSMDAEFWLAYYVMGTHTLQETKNMLHEHLLYDINNERNNFHAVVRTDNTLHNFQATAVAETFFEVLIPGYTVSKYYVKYKFSEATPEFDVKKNEKLIIYFYSHTKVYKDLDPGAVGMNVIAQPKCDIEILCALNGENATIPAISVGSAFQKITQKMLNAEASEKVFESRWFAEQIQDLDSGYYRSGKTDYLTTGKAFRNDNKISLSIKDLFDAMNNIYCLGMSISQNNRVKRVRCETRDFYFACEYGGHIGEVSEFKEELAEDLIYKAIDFQNEQIKEEEYSNRFAFNVPFSFKTPINVIDTAIDLRQPICTSAITLELARRAAKNKDESDFDDKIFLVKLTNQKQTLQDKDDDDTLITTALYGIPDYTYLANQDYCPARTLRYYWGWWLTGCLQFVRDKLITLEKNDYNRSFASTRLGQDHISTSSNYSIGYMMADERYSSEGIAKTLPRHEPYYHKFKAKMTYELSKILELNRHKVFSYDTAEGRKYGYISSVPTIPGKVSEFVMIKASKYTISKL